MQFKVPQNIDMADRIVGPLTLVQFLYILVGGMVVYFLFSTIAPVNGGLFLLLSAPVAVFTMAMAFLKVQDQPFPKFVQAFIVFLFRPKIRMWHKEGSTLSPKIVPEVKKESDKPVVPQKIEKSQLEKLIQVMDTGGTSANRVGAPAHKAAHVSPSLNKAPQPKDPNRRSRVNHGQK